MSKRKIRSESPRLEVLIPSGGSRLQCVRDLLDEWSEKQKEMLELQSKLYDILKPVTIDREEVRREKLRGQIRAHIDEALARRVRELADLEILARDEEEFSAEFESLRSRAASLDARRRELSMKGI